MNSSENSDILEKSKTDSAEIWRWRISQMDIPTQLLRLSVLLAGFLIWQ